MKTNIISVQTLEWKDRYTGESQKLYTVNYYGSVRSLKCMSRYFDQSDRDAGRIPQTVLRFMETHKPKFFPSKVGWATPATAGYYVRAAEDT